MRNFINLIEGPTTLYHETSSENRESIFRHGLLRSKSETAELARSMGDSDHDAGGIFFSDRINPHQPGIDVWEVDVRGLPLEPDETTDHEHTGAHWYVDWESDAIGPARLNLLSERIVTEAPISDINLLGDWDKSSSFRAANDRKLLQNPKAVAKMKTQWRYPEDVDSNIIIVNNADANNHFFVGEVSRENLATMFPRTIDQITPLIRGDQINIIYASNKGSPRHPMTGWIMAHRLGHVLNLYRRSSHYFKEAEETFLRYLGDLMPQYGLRMQDNFAWRFDTPTLKLVQALGTFRSAREGKLAAAGEVMYELFAQYIFTGRIKFNDIPQSIKYKNSTYFYRGGDDYDSDNHTIQHDLSYELTQFFETAMHYSVGKILVV